MRFVAIAAICCTSCANEGPPSSAAEIAEACGGTVERLQSVMASMKNVTSDQSAKFGKCFVFGGNGEQVTIGFIGNEAYREGDDV